MRPDPFTDPGDDSEEPACCWDPAGSPPSDGSENDHDGFPDFPVEQGLFLTVPAGSFDSDQLAQSGPAADMPPDPLLATIIDVTAGPDGSGMAGLTGDQLIGVIAGSRRLESRAAWYTLAAVAEFTARSDREELVGEFAADELACELHLTTQSAAGLMDYARAVTTRLPRCFAALGAGLLYPVHLRIIEEETRILADEDAAKATPRCRKGRAR